MTTMEATKTTIRYQATCDQPMCQSLTWRIYRQLNVPKYSDGVSILKVPDWVEVWRGEHRTARKRADRCARLGYEFRHVDNSQHSRHIYEINNSKPERQGRPMSAGYTEYREHGPLPKYECDRHRINTYGVLKEDVLYA